MPKFILYVFLMLLLFPTTASAENSVDVNIKNSSSYKSSSTVNNETNIVIESNGVRQEYHGSDSDINMQSPDGKTTVKVNNGTATNKPSSSPSASAKVTSKTNISVNSSTSDSGSPSPSATSSATPSPAVAGVSINMSDNDDKGFWASFKKQLEAFFKLFS